MKYKIAFSALLAAALLGAHENDYEISAMGGYTIPSDGQFLNDYSTYGAEMQFNGFDFAIKPEVSVFYSDADYKYNNGSTKVLQTALNGVYSFNASGEVTPFLKVGVGYESMSNNAFGNHDGVTVDAGMGLKFDITKKIALKLEAIKMLKHNDNSSDNNLLLVGGLAFAFGDNGQNDLAPDSTPESQSSMAPTAVTEKSVPPSSLAPITVAPIVVATPIDHDQQGHSEQNDLCAKIPLRGTINDHFVFNSDHIDSTAASEIRAFVVFMKENPHYKATITGHTDSIGTPEYNQKLSIKRAENVKEALVSQGIEAERLSVIGKGESMPIMSNMLEAGRAENRRIEVDIHE